MPPTGNDEQQVHLPNPCRLAVAGECSTPITDPMWKPLRLPTTAATTPPAPARVGRPERGQQQRRTTSVPRWVARRRYAPRRWQQARWPPDPGHPPAGVAAAPGRKTIDRRLCHPSRQMAHRGVGWHRGAARGRRPHAVAARASPPRPHHRWRSRAAVAPHPPSQAQTLTRHVWQQLCPVRHRLAQPPHQRLFINLDHTGKGINPSSTPPPSRDHK